MFIPLHYSFYQRAAVELHWRQQARLLVLVEAEGQEVACQEVEVLQIARELFLAPLVVGIAAPYLQLDDVLMIVIIYDKVCTGFIACFGFYIVVTNAVDDWAYVELKLFSAMFLHELGVHRSVGGTEDFVEVLGELL